MGHEFDPFQLEIIKNSFDAIADDMALTLLRTSHSSIVRDSMDFSTAICDAAGQTLAQGVCTPMQLGSFYDANKGPGTVDVYCTCAVGEHRMSFIVDAAGPSEALGAMPSGFLRTPSTVSRVEPAYEFATGAR